jgi:hypothetical protein
VQLILGGVESTQIAQFQSETSCEPSVTIHWWNGHREPFYSWLGFQIGRWPSDQNFRVTEYTDSEDNEVNEDLYRKFFLLFKAC